MTPASSPEEFWNQAHQVDAYPTSLDLLDYERSLIANAIIRASQTGSIDEVHVIGVGTGRELAAIRTLAPKARIQAWDISQRMVDACTKRVDASGWENVSVSRSDLLDLPSLRPEADVLIALSAVLCFLTPVSNRVRGFNQLSHILRPGGSVALVVQQRFGRLDRGVWLSARSLVAKAGLIPGEPGDRISRSGDAWSLVHHYSRHELATLLRRSDLEGEVQSLRQWARTKGDTLRLRSPNPLLALAVKQP